MDHDQDPGLCAVDERAAEAISTSIKDGPVACIQVGSTFPCRMEQCQVALLLSELMSCVTVSAARPYTFFALLHSGVYAGPSSV